MDNNPKKISTFAFLSIFIFLFAGLILISCSTTIRQKKNDLAMGVWNTGYPYVFVDQNGNLNGFDIEIAKKIAQKLEKTIIFKDMPFDLLVSALRTNDLDIIGSSFIITQKKLELMDMIDIYGKPSSELTFVFWQNIPPNITNIADIKKQSISHPIAARADSAWVEVLKEKEVEIMELERHSDVLMPLQYGQALAVVVGPRHAKVLQKQYPEIKILKIPLDKPWGEGVGLGVKKGNIKLKEQLEKAVKELKEDGTIADLKKKWFGEGAQ